MHKVYRAINVTRREVYHGVSKDLRSRKEKSHCVGATKAIQHWNCETDKIIWREVSNHRKQKNASLKSHNLEKKYRHHKGFKNIQTKGI